MPTKVKDIMLEGTGLHSLFKRVAAEAGLNLVSGSFEEGGTLSNINDVLLHIAEARYYSWGIGGNKEVPAGSTPATAGGIGVGVWNDKTDLTLRSDLKTLYPRLVNKTVTVGTAGDFQTLNDALTYCSEFLQSYVQGGALIEVKLLSGYVMQEQVFMRGVDLSYVVITSEDAEVVIDRASLTIPVGVAEIRYMAFSFMDGTKAPIIDVLFNMNSTGTATGRGGFRCESSWLYILQGGGCKNVGDRGLHLVNSIARANKSIFSGAGNRGIRVGNNSHLWAEGCDCTNAGESGIAVDGSCTANVAGSDVSGAAVYGLLALAGAVVRAEDLTANNCYTALYNSSSVVFAQGLKSTSCTRDAVVTDNGGLTCISTSDTVITLAGQDGVVSRNGARVDAHAASVTNSNRYNLNAQRTASIDGSTGVFTGAGQRGCYVEGSFVSLKSADISGSGSAADLLPTSGSIVDFTGGTGTFGQTPNIPAAHGIVFNSSVVANKGGASIAVGSTYVDVTHGLSGTPTNKVNVTPSGSSNATKFWISNVGATTFRINVDTAITTSVANFSWNCSL